MTDTSQATSTRSDAPFPLAPMTTADLLDTTFSLIRANWRPLVSLSLLLAVPLSVATFVINMIFGSDSGTVTGSSLDGLTSFGNSGLGAVLAISLVSFVASVVVTPLVTGAMTRVVAGAYLGRQFDARQALQSMVPFWLALMGAMAVSRVSQAVGIAFFIIGTYVAQALFWAVVPVIAVEEVGGMTAIKRSFTLMAKRFFPYLGIMLVYSVVGQGLAWITSFLPTVLGLVTAESVALSSFFQGATSIISTVVLTPFAAVMALLVYFDARVRVEGFDIQMRAARLPDPTGPQGPVSR